jgi:hypothetical protein
VVSSLRTSNVASATIGQALRSLVILWLVLDARRIDLADQLRQVQFPELDEVKLCQRFDLEHPLDREQFKSYKTKRILPARIRSLEQYRTKINSPNTVVNVQSSTKDIRPSYIRHFLCLDNRFRTTPLSPS